MCIIVSRHELDTRKHWTVKTRSYQHMPISLSLLPTSGNAVCLSSAMPCASATSDSLHSVRNPHRRRGATHTHTSLCGEAPRRRCTHYQIQSMRCSNVVVVLCLEFECVAVLLRDDALIRKKTPNPTSPHSNRHMSVLMWFSLHSYSQIVHILLHSHTRILT